MFLRVDRLNVFHGKLHVLWDVSFDVERGEFITFLGMKGAGKSTLLNTIAGIYKPHSGTIIFNGERIDNLRTYMHVPLGISIVPEDKKLFSDLTVLENLLLGAYTIKNEDERKESLEIVYQVFPILKERRNQVVMSLSGGEQRMLAIGRALMAHPKLLLLDEPSQGLAPKVIFDIFKALKRIQEQGVTIVMSEQSVLQALKFSERCYIIENGKVVFGDLSQNLLKDAKLIRKFL